jgi:uncharacterized protein (DUF1684 family)
MSSWGFLFFAISIATASAQSLRQNEYSVPNAQVLATQRRGHDHSLRVVVTDGHQKDIKYVFLNSEHCKRKSFPAVSRSQLICQAFRQEIGTKPTFN